MTEPGVDPKVQEALDAHERGDLAAAARDYQAILDREPGHFLALHQLGVLENQLGHFDRGLALLTTAVNLRPRSALAHFNLANAHLNLGRQEEALVHFHHAITLDPAFIDAHLNAAVAQQSLGRPEEALARLDRVLALDGTHVEALVNRSVVLGALGHTVDAAASLEQARLLAPDHPAVLKALGTATPSTSSRLLKLNLGCGFNKHPDYLNVDLFPECEPDLQMDLEATPWVWADASVEEMVFNHSLEHLGGDPKVFLAMMKEIHRIASPGCRILINVPHPRHDHFLGDPTHVRPITPQLLQLFSKRLNLEWKERGVANSPLGLYLNVDFELESVTQVLAEPYATAHQEGRLSDEEVLSFISERNNVVSELRIVLRALK